uniref:Uncharacterized protein n=1 Tax=Timema shepardi TaxID=629360 RepID=A0A7R9G2E6_TIMSH|nr:unnamed protein product [Timema shepardi]
MIMMSIHIKDSCLMDSDGCGPPHFIEVARKTINKKGHSQRNSIRDLPITDKPDQTKLTPWSVFPPIGLEIGKVELEEVNPHLCGGRLENHLGKTTPVHLTKIRTSISPSSAVELNTNSALANYATEASFKIALQARIKHIFKALQWAYPGDVASLSYYDDVPIPPTTNHALQPIGQRDVNSEPRGFLSTLPLPPGLDGIFTAQVRLSRGRSDSCSNPTPPFLWKPLTADVLCMRKTVGCLLFVSGDLIVDGKALHDSPVNSCAAFYIRVLIGQHLKSLNAYFSSHPPVYEKDTKIFVLNCALHSASGMMLHCFAHAHIGEWAGRRDCQVERALLLSQCQLWRDDGRKLSSMRFTPTRLLLYICVLIIIIVVWMLFKKSQSLGFTRTCPHPEQFQDQLHQLADKVNRILSSLQLTHFLCYGSLWGQIRLSRSLPWEADVEFCLLNEELSLHDEVFLARAFKKHKLDMKYNSAEGLYMITDPQFEGGNIQLIVFEEDTTINMLRRVGWKRRMLPPNCEEMTSLECFPPRLIARPLPLKEFGGYILPVPREGIEIQKYHYQQSLNPGPSGQVEARQRLFGTALAAERSCWRAGPPRQVVILQERTYVIEHD